MKVNLKKSSLINEIPSGSGMEYINGELFVCGDDASFLYKLALDGSILNKIKVFDWKDESRIPKALKPDFEAMAVDGDDVLLFGSGSLTQRNLLVKINSKSEIVKEYSLEKFYAGIKNKSGLTDDDFNLEGATVFNHQLLLLNRGDNSIFTISLNEFYACVEKGKELSNVTISKYFLPIIDGCNASFSGACVTDDYLFFCASVEKTSDWINDGEILGSFIGLIHLCGNINEISECEQVFYEGKPYLGKIEGLCAIGKKGNTIEMKAICDNDDGRSTFLEIEIVI